VVSGRVGLAACTRSASSRRTRIRPDATRTRTPPAASSAHHLAAAELRVIEEVAGIDHGLLVVLVRRCRRRAQRMRPGSGAGDGAGARSTSVGMGETSMGDGGGEAACGGEAGRLEPEARTTCARRPTARRRRWGDLGHDRVQHQLSGPVDAAMTRPLCGPVAVATVA